MDGRISQNSESRGDEIARVNSIRFTIYINLLQLCTVMASVTMLAFLKLTVSAQSIYRDVYGTT